MSVLSEIYDGWKNFIFENEEVEAMAKKRIAICVDCDSYTSVNTCKHCGCYMPFKTRSPKSTCPEELW